MPKQRSPFSLSSFIVSLREFARNPAIRRKALKQNRPVIIEQSRERSFFVLLPPTLYDKLYELYRDLKDNQDLQEAMKKKDDWYKWEDVKKELSA